MRRSGLRGLLVFAALGIGGAAVLPAQGIVEDPAVVGGAFPYAVRDGDSLARVGARFGVAPRVLAEANGLPPDSGLRIGQVLRVENRHIVPFPIPDGILINVPQRLLFVFREGRLVAWYPVGTGRSGWPTPAGSFRVRILERDPTWDVPVSIQREMRQQGKQVVTRVPPGPANPLGAYWIGIESTGCGIHGTNAPASVYGFRTHGCIRLHPDDIADLFVRVAVGTPVEIVYEPVLLARASDGGVYLEVNPDPRGASPDPARTARELAERQGLLSEVDPDAVRDVAQRREGLARRVDLRPPP